MMRRFLLATATIGLLLGAGCTNPSPTTTNSLPTTQHIYSDDRISFSYSDAWEARQPVDERRDVAMAGIQLVQGGYTFSLLTHQQTVSPVTGGRFSDVSSYTTSIGTINDTNWLDAANCLPSSQTTKISDTISRVDLFLDTAQLNSVQKEACGNPQGPGVVWYGSYFTENCSIVEPSTSSWMNTACNGYYMSYDDLIHAKAPGKETGSQEYLVFAIRANAENANNLPQLNDEALQEILISATEVVEGIEWKY